MDIGQEEKIMPLGVMQNNSFLKLTLDVWQDKVFYCAREYPAGYFAASVLDISDDELFETMEASAAILAHHQLITTGSNFFDWRNCCGGFLRFASTTKSRNAI